MMKQMVCWGMMLCLWSAAGAAQEAKSEARLSSDGALELAVAGAAPVRFEPRFTIIAAPRASADKTLRLTAPYLSVQAWAAEKGKLTANLFQAGAVTEVAATHAEKTGGVVKWNFPANERFELTVEATLGEDEPLLHFRFTPRQKGCYSIGYTGAPQAEKGEVDALWQPMLWFERRLPAEPYLTTEVQCPLPATLVTRGGVTAGVVVDPACVPFRIPTRKNSLFGVAVRNASGKAQPMVFAPVLGGVGSAMEAGKSFEFSVRLVARRAPLEETFEHLARGLYGFHDYRRNTTCSLNRTLDNMIEFAMSKAAYFDEENRGAEYVTDMPGAVKNVSPLHPLGVALVTDDEAIYRRRALPLMEYGISRSKLLFSATGEKGSQSASSELEGPCLPVSELASLYRFSRGGSPVFLQGVLDLYQKDRTLNMTWVTRGGTWQQLLAAWRATGERKYLDEARLKADRYLKDRIQTPQTDFAEGADGTFWDYFFPAWKELLELYEETGEARYLAAAHQGARRYAQLMWFTPPIPDRTLNVNEGGKAPVRSKGEPIAVAEESVAAWRVSEVGLTDEGNGTSGSHRGIFLATHAPYFMRLAQLTGDGFLRDIARSAMVGRYESFPGYHMNTAYSTVYEKTNFPYIPNTKNSFTSMHPNHIWPQVALVLDTLVSDAADRSAGAIAFPSEFVECYAYLQSRVYGDRPGRFYGEKDVWLWMPKGLVKTDNVQLNWIAARGEGTLCVALMNLGEEAVEATLTLDPMRAGLEAGKEYQARVWRQNAPAAALAVREGRVRVAVAGKGITALVIEGAAVRPAFQHKALGQNRPWAVGETALPLGGARGLVLSMGPDLTSAYVYLKATAAEFKEVRLVGKADGKPVALKDGAFPFEFTVPLAAGAERFEFALEGVHPDGKTERSATAVMKRTK